MLFARSRNSYLKRCRAVGDYGYHLWLDRDRESRKSYSINLNVCRYEEDKAKGEVCKKEADAVLRDDRQIFDLGD